MPTRPAAGCRVWPCPQRATYRGLCPEHARQDSSTRFKRNAGSLYNDPEWRKASKAFVTDKACIDCGKPAQVTDHSVPHKGNRELFWRRDLWRPRCWSCHSRKTATIDGGFGRRTTT